MTRVLYFTLLYFIYGCSVASAEAAAVSDEPAVAESYQESALDESSASSDKSVQNCGQNEEIRCVKKCPPEKTCRNRNIKYKCKVDKSRCKKKCVCKAGYFRNTIGQCITADECNQCSKPHKYYSCGGACDNVCSTIKFQNQTNCPIQNIVCNKMCYCDPGYARDEKGNCIPIKQCPPSCSDPNEEYILTKTCPPDLCMSLVAKYKCDSNEVEQYRCRCKSGYLRPSKGSACVTICECPEMASSPDCTAVPS